VFIMPPPVCIYVHKIMLQFYVCFCAFITHVVRYLFPYLTFSLSCAILSQAGLLEVLVAYRGSLGYFLAQSLLLLNGCSSERLMLTGGGGSRVCSLLSHVLYPKHVHFTSLILAAKYWGSGRRLPLSKTITITRIASH
jgi:hypothetical protein